MRKLPLCSSAQVIKALEADGFVGRRKSKGGSHRAYVKERPDGTHLATTVVLAKKELPSGTLKRILELAQISDNEFLKLLK